MSLFDDLRKHLVDDPTQPRAAGIEISQTLEPAGGLPVWPPSYEGRIEIHDRHIDGETRPVVELDSVGSAANRIEEVLLELQRAGKYGLPIITTNVTIDDAVHPITTLDAPHRTFDAWIRLSQDAAGVNFEDSERGHELTTASLRALDPILEASAHDLLFGSWDSHRKGPNGQLRIARAVTTSLIGLDAIPQAQFAARVDPLNLGDASEGGKHGKRLSEQGLSSIPPQKNIPYEETRKSERAGNRGGVSISEARYQGFLSFAALRKLGFANYDPADVRTLLVSLGLYGLTLRAAQGFELRARASLIPQGALSLALVRPDGAREALSLDVASASALFEEAKSRVKINDRSLTLDAGAELNALVAQSLAADAKSKG